jgi:hypothetical protein
MRETIDGKLPDFKKIDVDTEINKYVLPTVRRVYPTLTEHDIVAIQPMQSPSSMIFYQQYKFDKSCFVEGDIIIYHEGIYQIVGINKSETDLFNDTLIRPLDGGRTMDVSSYGIRRADPQEIVDWRMKNGKD